METLPQKKIWSCGAQCYAQLWHAPHQLVHHWRSLSDVAKTVR